MTVDRKRSRRRWPVASVLCLLTAACGAGALAPAQEALPPAGAADPGTCLLAERPTSMLGLPLVDTRILSLSRVLRGEAVTYASSTAGLVVWVGLDPAESLDDLDFEDAVLPGLPSAVSVRRSGAVPDLMILARLAGLPGPCPGLFLTLRGGDPAAAAALLTRLRVVATPCTDHQSAVERSDACDRSFDIDG